MQRRYAVDRFESQCAVLEDEDGTTIDVPRDWLPGHTAEGDVVYVNLVATDADADRRTVVFVRDKAERQRQIEEAVRPLERMQTGPKGDIEL